MSSEANQTSHQEVLDVLGEFDPEEIRATVEAVNEAEDAASMSSLSRRDILALGSVFGLSTVLGWVGGQQSVQKAAADASTSDDEGDVGQPDDRVDVFADGIDGKSASIDTLDFRNLTPDYRYGSISYGLPDSDPTTTSTNNEQVFDFAGAIHPTDIPDGMAMYGKLTLRMSNSQSGETIYAVPEIFTDTDGATQLTEMELSVTSTGDTTVSSGWTKITSISTSEIWIPVGILGRVSSGTGKFKRTTTRMEIAGVDE